MYSNYGTNDDYNSRASKRPKTEGNLWDDSDEGVSYGYGYVAQPGRNDNYTSSYSTMMSTAGPSSNRYGQDNSSFGDWLAKSASGPYDSNTAVGGNQASYNSNNNDFSQGFGGYGNASAMEQKTSFQQPAFQQPSFQQPSFQQQSFQQPSFQNPSYQQPSYQTSTGMMGGKSNTGAGVREFGGAQGRTQSKAGSFMGQKSGGNKSKNERGRRAQAGGGGSKFGNMGTNQTGRNVGGFASGSGSRSGGTGSDSVGNAGQGFRQQQGGFQGTMDQVRGGFGGNDDNDDFITNFTLRMATQMQQKKQGKVDVKKLLKVIEIVDQLTESGGDDFGQIEQFANRSGSGGFGAGTQRQGMMGGGGGAGGGMNRMGMMNTMQGGNFNPMNQRMGGGSGMTGGGGGGGMMGGGGSLLGDGMGFGGGARFGNNVGIGALFNTGARGMSFNSGGGKPGFGGNYGNRGGGMQDRRNSPMALLDMPFQGGYGGDQRFRPEKRRHPDEQMQQMQQRPFLQPKTLSEKLQRFCEVLRQQPHIPNPITKLEENLNNSGINLNLDYKFEELMRFGAKFGAKYVVTGRLSLGNMFIARAMGDKKKDVMFMCYKKALRVLLTMSVVDIMRQKDKSTDTIKQELLKEYENKKGTEKEGEKRPPGLKHYEEELQKLIDYLKSPPEPSENDFGMFIDAISGSGCELVRNYAVITTYVSPTVMMYTGRLSIAGTLLGVATASLRRNAKGLAFSRAVAFLKEKDMKEIVEGYEPPEDDFNLALFKEVSDRQAASPNDKTESKLAQLINTVAKLPKTKDTDVSAALDKAVTNGNLLLTLLNKRIKQEGSAAIATSELYIDNLFMASGEGSKQPIAKTKVYEGVIAVLSSTSADVLVSDCRRLSPEDLQDAILVKEAWAKADCSTFNWSNVTKMRAGKKGLYFCSQQEDVPRNKENFVIVESHRYSVDRYKFAYDILLQSANMNMMLLRGKTVWYANMHRCELFLEGEKISDGIAKNRAGATMKAASKFLFAKYQERPTIQSLMDTENTVWNTYDSIKEVADKLKLESGEGADSDETIYIQDAPSKQAHGKENTTEQTDAETKQDPQPMEGHTDPVATLPVNKWVKQVMEDMIIKFSKRETLEDLVFGLGFPDGERRQMFLTANKHKLYCTNRKTANQEKYTVIYCKYPIGMQLKILEDNGGVCGKFSILDKDTLPSVDKMKDYIQASVKAAQEKRAANVEKSGKNVAGEWKRQNKVRANKRLRTEKKARDMQGKV